MNLHREKRETASIQPKMILRKFLGHMGVPDSSCLRQVRCLAFFLPAWLTASMRDLAGLTGALAALPSLPRSAVLVGNVNSDLHVPLRSPPGVETIPHQGSRALIMKQTCRGSFSAVSKLIKYPFLQRFTFSRCPRVAYFCEAKRYQICRLLQYFATFRRLMIFVFRGRPWTATPPTRPPPAWRRSARTASPSARPMVVETFGYFLANFEMPVLGCIDAKVCK